MRRRLSAGQDAPDGITAHTASLADFDPLPAGGNQRRDLFGRGFPFEVHTRSILRQVS
ncbi:hypothetical protein [Sinorhizobium meliloti]|uniref:hypothetical protein n=1 Tax=Rhizobium meliloti TaxID=382 RepID=UPI001F35D45A|nr:hypothetical protein [Sinorhizobium meliloti]